MEDKLKEFLNSYKIRLDNINDNINKQIVLRYSSIEQMKKNEERLRILWYERDLMVDFIDGLEYVLTGKHFRKEIEVIEEYLNEKTGEMSNK